MDPALASKFESGQVCTSSGTRLLKTYLTIFSALCNQKFTDAASRRLQ
jgi:hypothetical protein